MPRAKFLRVRMSDEELAAIKDAASRAGATVSAFARAKLLKADSKPQARFKAEKSPHKPSRIYLTDRELAELKSNAQAVNMSVSEYVRSRCVYRPAPYVSVDRDALLESHRELYKQGVNLNQIAQKLNMAGNRGDLGNAVQALSSHLAVTLDDIVRLVAKMERIIGGTYRDGWK